jgi:8-oxo-dGTP pyrophosphatase MutT (NUDIX family)
MDYKSYEDLPRRALISSAQKTGLKTREKKLESYGIMARIKSTNRWLLVRTRNSAALSFILHGAYQPVHLRKLLYGLTINELTTLQDIVTSGSEDHFSDYYYSVFQNHSHTDYSYKRLMDMRDDIMNFDEENSMCQDTSFSFPKGRRNLREDTIATASREFYEETGVTMNTVIHTPVSYTVKGHSDRIYNIKCWISEYEKEIYLDDFNPIDTKEIAERQWVEIDPLDIRDHKGLRGEGKLSSGKIVVLENSVFELIRESIRLGL